MRPLDALARLHAGWSGPCDRSTAASAATTATSALGTGSGDMFGCSWRCHKQRHGFHARARIRTFAWSNLRVIASA